MHFSFDHTALTMCLFCHLYHDLSLYFTLLPVLKRFFMSFKSYFMSYNKYFLALVICAFIKQRHKNPKYYFWFSVASYLSSLGFFKRELWCTIRKAQTSSNSKSRKYQWKPVSQRIPNVNTCIWKILIVKKETIAWVFSYIGIFEHILYHIFDGLWWGPEVI